MSHVQAKTRDLWKFSRFALSAMRAKRFSQSRWPVRLTEEDTVKMQSPRLYICLIQGSVAQELHNMRLTALYSMLLVDQSGPTESGRTLPVVEIVYDFVAAARKRGVL